MLKQNLLAFSAAALWSSSVLAADLPMAKAAPVEYVRVCTIHGAGFFYIPGSDTCVKLGGRVRADFGYYQPSNSWSPKATFYGSDAAKTPKRPFEVYGTGYVYGRDVDATGYRIDARFSLDLRTSTDWGLLRAFLRYEARSLSGPLSSSSNLQQKNNATNSFARIETAFVQWAGLTAGRVQSFFDFYTNLINFQDLVGTSDTKVNAFAYTATFGKGFSATLAIEDRTDRQQAVQWAVPLALQDIRDGASAFAPWFAPNSIGYGGTRLPDIVGNLLYEGEWGQAQLTGALHQIFYPSFGAPDYTSNGLGRYLAVNYGCPATASAGACPLLAPYSSADYGYALQAGVKINLPMLAKGDALWLQATYANGATSYLGPKWTIVGPAIAYAADSWIFPGFNSDGTVNGQVTTETVKGYSFLAALHHYWTPSVRQGLFGSYLKLDNPAAIAPAWTTGVTPGVDAYGYGAPDATIWQIGTNVIWSPVKSFDIGAEIGYINNDAGSRPVYQVKADNGDKYWLREGQQGQFYTRIRLQRDF